jgi:DNA-binding beta-propeller fold protein YncE
MLALYRSGRQADALEAFRAARRTFVEELGIEPGEELKELHRRILAHDPTLSPPTPPPAKAPPRPSARPEPVDVLRRRGPGGRGLVVLLAAVAILVAVVLAAISFGRDDSSPVVMPNSVVKIDPATNTVVGVVPVGGGPVALASVGRNLWVANRTDDTLTRVDTRSHETRTFGGFSYPISLAAEGPRIWVGSESSADVIAIDAALGSVLERVRVKPAPAGFVAFGEGSLWVSQGVFDPTIGRETPSAVSRVDVLAREVATTRLRHGDWATQMAVGGGASWVSLTGTGTLLRIDAADGTRRRISIGSAPSGIAVGFGAVWVASAGDDVVRRVNPMTGSVEDVIEVGDEPLGVAVGAGSVWVGNQREGTVSRIDPSTGRVVATIRLGFFPTALRVAGGALWVSVLRDPAFDGSQQFG